jgi:isoquinoline 1-oxidoreductase alpha subunit
MQITLNVNNESFTVDIEPETPLLWVLRDSIGLTGTKYGCGISQCGACTVHIDGQAMRSCDTTAASVVGRQIATIEGLSSDSSHPVQQAWRELSVAQCGYCQSGQLMQAAALLERSPKPSDSEIDTAMAGNVCRCGTYLQIRAAIHRAADIGQA